MSEKTARVTLSVGRDGSGPRTVGEINAFGLSFALYQAWMYMAVFGAPKTFRCVDGMWLPFLPANLQSFLIFSFLGVSAICLLLLAVFEQKASQLVGTRKMLVVATGLSFVGTVCVWICSSTGIPGAIAAGVLMGAGASLFLALWGCAFARFKFATATINAAIAFAVGFIVAVAFTNWIPSPFSGIIAILMPLFMAAAFLRRDAVSIKTNKGVVEAKYIRGYIVKFVVSLILFGFALGGMRAICGTRLLAFSELSTELVLAGGCFFSVVVLVGAIIFYKRETSWDSLFRFVSPAIILGIAALSLLLGNFSVLGSFFISLGYVCLEAILWIFLACMAKSLEGSPVFVFGLGYGALQAASALGTAVVFVFFAYASTAEIGNIALLLITVIAFAYAVLPRYRELKIVLASVLSDMLSKHGAVDPSMSPVALEESAETLSVAEKATADASESPTQPTVAPNITAEAADTVETPAIAEEMPEAIVETISEDIQAEESIKRDPKGSFTRRCEELARKYKLSAREKDVLFLLAKGHNAAFITEQLCISRATAKTHINHIYKKVDVHTQQELLNMVEDRHRGPGPGITFGSMGAAVSPDYSDYDKLREAALKTLAHHDAEMAAKLKGENA